MIRCRTCLIPNTRPDTPIIDGECAACISFKKRFSIDWEAREREFIALLDRHDGRVIVPSSGGKDSTYQVLKLLEYGCDVTAITARTCHLTPIGRRNIDNLARYVRTIEVTPNMTVRAKLNRLGLQLIGDISLPEHWSIFSTPFRMASDLGIKLIMYGENSQAQYGGPLGSDEAKQKTRRWVSEFGGNGGIRPSDMIGVEGITERDMADYILPSPDRFERMGIEAHFLGQYEAWDSHRNAEVSMAHGMEAALPSPANWWIWENLDNSQTGAHDFLMYKKYAYGRGCAQISVDIRQGLIDRESALKWIETHDGIFPEVYAGVPIDEMLERIGMDRPSFMKECEKWASPSA